MMTAMKQPVGIALNDLLPAVYRRPALRAIAVTGITSDSRQIKPGDVFVAVCGRHVDARNFIAQAIHAGAVAVLVDAVGTSLLPEQISGVPIIPLCDLEQNISGIAGEFYGHPSRKIKVIGITGTNGKTSTAFWMANALYALGYNCGLIGTLGSGLAGSELTPTGLTTPDAITTQRLLADFVLDGVAYAVMEVSSHSLVQGRVAAIKFAATLFTNLTHDHLDYHGDMAAYAAAKAVLFKQCSPSQAVINVDDQFGRALVAQLPLGVHAYSYSLHDAAADFYIQQSALRPDGMTAVIKTSWGEGSLLTRQVGEYNLANLLGVAGVLCALGLDIGKVMHALSDVPSVPGRLERIETTSGIQVFVDYAHTPDALRNVLSALKQHTTARLWCVFGCGGDRDCEKRPVMGGVACDIADVCLITSDNPRSEDPAMIIADIRAGLSAASAEVIVQPDRALAIRYAISHATLGDTVLIAGKGHEQFQVVADQQLPFSDVVEARLALRTREAVQS